jgi:hypothetical protein
MLLLPLACLAAALFVDERARTIARPVEGMGSLSPVMGGRDPNGRGLSPAMGTRIPLQGSEVMAGTGCGCSTGEGRYGILPLLAGGAVLAEGGAAAAAGEGTVLLGPWAGSTVVPVVEAGTGWAVAGSTALLGLLLASMAVGNPGDWSPSSPTWQGQIHDISASAAAAGHPLNPDCAWLFSGQTRIRKMAQDAAEALKRKHPNVAERSLVDQVNRAWTMASTSAKGVGTFSSENIPNFLGVPPAAGLLTQAMANVEAIWWARFLAGLVQAGVAYEDLGAIEDAISTSQLLCRQGIGNVPKPILSGFGKYFAMMRGVRRAILQSLLKLANPKTMAVNLLGSTIGVAVFEFLKDAARDAADTHGGLFEDLHEALDAMATETSGVLPAGRAMWRAEAMEAMLVDPSGKVFEEGLVLPGRYHIRVRLRPGETPTLLQVRGKPTELEVKEGHVYTMVLDGKKTRIQDDNLRPRL